MKPGKQNSFNCLKELSANGKNYSYFSLKEAEKNGAQTLGIRPEHIDIVSSGGIWKGKVGVTEHLGSDTFIHVHETGLSKVVTVRASGEVKLKYGDEINLNPRSDLFHKFDTRGIRLE